MKDVDEFYIGWQGQAPGSIASHTRKVVVTLGIILIALAGILALAQRTIGVASFEWGTLKTFSGILKLSPYPHLLTPRPGQNTGPSTYYLVAPFKFGLKADNLAALDGKAVTLKGTLVYRGKDTMIEARPESIRPTEAATAGIAASAPISLGQQTLIGEIVDSKCYLGVMNPGRLPPHRACAVRCISGGVPPILLVRQNEGPSLCFLLVSSSGSAVNKQVLDMVAEPVLITGEVVQQGELLMLYADPATYRRVSK